MKSIISKVLLRSEVAIKSFLGGVIHSIFTVLWVIIWLPVAVHMAFSESYYPELNRKNIVHRLIENIIWTLKYHRANTFYTLYGLDVAGSKGDAFIDEKGFWKGLNKLNYSKGVAGQVCLLRDKLLFFKYMDSNGMPVPEVFALIKDGEVYNTRFEKISLADLKNETGYFMKDIDGECASFVKRVHDYNELCQLIEQKKEGQFILQRAIHQAEAMNQLNPCAVNTLRVVTVYNGGNPIVLSALLRVGTSHSGNVDNWAAGGLAIGIQENGYLKKYGLHKPGHGLKASTHPDSGIEFEKFEVPMLKEALECACKAHKCFYEIGAIGWDIAISEDGPVFIEGNDNFEITLMQACDRPLKCAWEEIYK